PRPAESGLSAVLARVITEPIKHAEARWRATWVECLSTTAQNSCRHHRRRTTPRTRIAVGVRGALPRPPAITSGPANADPGGRVDVVKSSRTWAARCHRTWPRS